MNAVANTLIQQAQQQAQHHHHHQQQQQQDEFSHARSHSDPTKNNTSPFYHHHLKTPESEFAKFTSSLNINKEFSHTSLKRRRLDLNSDNEDNELITFENFKRSRTAPPSPPYEIDEDLRLKSPLTLTDTIERARSLSLSPSKTLPTPLVSSDPIMPQQQAPSSPVQKTSPLLPPASSFNFTESMNEYPDTCYRYTTVATPVHSKLADFSSFENPYNQEWKQRLEILVKADDPVTYSRFKDYCNDVSKSSIRQLSISFNSKISKKIQKTANKKLADIISSKYQRNDKMKISSIINFPFENNYTYQSTGYLQDIDELVRSQSDQFKRNHSINLSKYNHIFNNASNEEIENDINARTHHHHHHHHHNQQQNQLPTRRRSQYGQSLATGVVTTDLPFNFTPTTSSTLPTKLSRAQLASPPQYNANLVNYNTSSSTNPPLLHTFVHASTSTPATTTTSTTTITPPHSVVKPNQASHTKILPPTTPKQTALPSPATSPSSKYNHHVRTCISCKSVHSPCWRPSWSITSGQLCNSCGLRYKKTGAHCLNDKCLRIPAKGEWTLMKNRGKLEFFDDKTKQLKYCYKCLHCGGEVDVNE